MMSSSRKLVVNEAEAETVRHIFRRYLELRSIEQLADELAAQGIKSKVRSASTMAAYGGRTIGRGALAYLLKNRVYIGEIGHKGSYYPRRARAADGPGAVRRRAEGAG